MKINRIRITRIGSHTLGVTVKNFQQSIKTKVFSCLSLLIEYYSSRNLVFICNLFFVFIQNFEALENQKKCYVFTDNYIRVSNQYLLVQRRSRKSFQLLIQSDLLLIG